MRWRAWGNGDGHASHGTELPERCPPGGGLSGAGSTGYQVGYPPLPPSENEGLLGGSCPV